MKRINEVFSDYEAGFTISNAIVDGVVLKKKSKILELKITSDKYIEFSEIEGLNNFIKERFVLNDSKITIMYTDEVKQKPIEETFENIMTRFGDKHPLLKAALNSCEYEIKDNKINFNFKIVVSHMLKELNYDKEIQDVLRNMYGKSYTINFIDDITDEELFKLNEEEHKKRMAVIKNELKSDASYPKTPQSKPVEKIMGNPYSKSGSFNQGDSKGESKKEDKGKKDNPFLILGRSANIKEPVIKITDISPYEGTVAVEGEISNMETKELRSGKILVSFDLYDNSSSISCKSFLKPEKSDEVLSRLKKAKGVRLFGNSGYSKFSGEIEDYC